MRPRAYAHGLSGGPASAGLALEREVVCHLLGDYSQEEGAVTWLDCDPGGVRVVGSDRQETESTTPIPVFNMTTEIRTPKGPPRFARSAIFHWK